MRPPTLSPVRRGRRAATRLAERLSRSVTEFLAIPIVIVAAFFCLALLLYVFDHDAGTRAHWGPLRSALGRYVGDGSAAGSLLTTIAGSLITVTSITFSILLLAVQQGASALTSQIIDHYLRRPSNRVYFGFFVGTSVFALVTLVLTTPASRPVLGVTFATLFTGVALFALILLIYSTINQIRPISVINAIHDTALAVRDGQCGWLPRTAFAADDGAPGVMVDSDRNGYLARVRVAELERLVRTRPGCRIHIVPTIGEFVARGMPLAVVDGAPVDAAFERSLRHALPIDEQRDVGCDAGASVDHLVNIAWTAMSTAKSNPAVGTVACHALQDILLRWTDEGGAPQQRDGAIRYRDRVTDQLLDGLESLVVVASESMQHQTLAIVMDTLSIALTRAGGRHRDRIETILLTSLPALGDHLPTRMLEASFARATDALRDDGRSGGGDRIAQAWRRLAATRGTVKSRGNRDEP